MDKAYFQFIETLNKLRKLARNQPLNVLVWGAGDTGKDAGLYQARCDVRKALEERKHSTYFSEELCEHETSLNDPLKDETLQAHIADAIVLVYGSRGTQTEMDKILSGDQTLIAKTIMVIEEKTLSGALASVSRINWENDIMPRAMKVIRYEQLPLKSEKLKEICNPLEDMRQKKYVEDQLVGGRYENK